MWYLQYTQNHHHQCVITLKFHSRSSGIQESVSYGFIGLLIAKKWIVSGEGWFLTALQKPNPLQSSAFHIKSTQCRVGEHSSSSPAILLITWRPRPWIRMLKRGMPTSFSKVYKKKRLRSSRSTSSSQRSSTNYNLHQPSLSSIRHHKHSSLPNWPLPSGQWPVQKRQGISMFVSSHGSHQFRFKVIGLPSEPLV